MQQETLQPPPTLEVTTASVDMRAQVPYTKYWPDFRYTQNLINLDDIYNTCRLSSYVTFLGSQVVRGATLEDVELMPDIRTDQPQEVNLGNAIAEWDRTTGSFNAFNEGQGDLLRAAGLLLYANFAGDPEEFCMTGTNSTDVYDQFSHLVKNNSWDRQQPSKDLLLAGQLVHKAAWIEEDTTRQEDLFKTAVKAYDRIYADSGATWTDRLLAGQYRADIYFYWLDQDIRQSLKDNDKADLKALHDIAVELLGEMASDILQAGRLVAEADEREEAVSGLTGGEWAGFMFEAFTMLAARDWLYMACEPKTASQYGIRRAFAHEDEPRNLKMKPKQSFDVVGQRRAIDGRVAETTPIQLKLQSNTCEPRAGDRRQDYDKRIAFIGVQNMGTDKMVHATHELLFSYANRKLKRGYGPLAVVQDIFSDLVDNMLVGAGK